MGLTAAIWSSFFYKILHFRLKESCSCSPLESTELMIWDKLAKKMTLCTPPPPPPPPHSQWWVVMAPFLTAVLADIGCRAYSFNIANRKAISLTESKTQDSHHVRLKSAFDCLHAHTAYTYKHWHVECILTRSKSWLRSGTTGSQRKDHRGSCCRCDHHWQPEERSSWSLPRSAKAPQGLEQ